MPPESVAEMLERVVLPDGTPTPWATGWQIPPTTRLVAVMTGQQEEATAVLVVVPDSGVSVAVLSNLERSAREMTPLAFRILQMLVD